ncbi:MAG: thioredoxin family protein [Planctomycetes bacterium]|nr:thioredoxin family protein [Planctomycetota bacterium]
MHRLRILIFLSAVLAAALPAVGQFSLDEANPSGGLFDSAPSREKSVVSVQGTFTAPTEGKPGELFVTAKIEPGWHIYSIAQPSGGPIATRITVDLPPGVRLTNEFRPSVAPDKKLEPVFDNIMVETHHGTVVWRAPLEFAAGVDPSTLRIEGAVTVQPCDANSCLPPRELPFTAMLGPAPLAASRAAPEGAAERLSLHTVLSQLLFAFLGGLILNIMPCVLPVISLKLLAFMQQAGESRGRVFALNVWYSIGLISVFMVLAALAATAGLAWGEQFTLPWFKVAMTGLVFVMALSFLGVWEIPIPGFVGAGKAGQLQTREGPAGAFFKGVFTTILATPCSGPFLGPVFGFLLGKPPFLVYGIFAAVGLGMASPYLIIGAFPKLIRYLPKPGGWMETFKQLMGFLLLATVIYLFSTLTTPYFLPTMTLLLGLWIACWWIGRTPATATPQVKATAWLGAIIVAVLVGRLAFTVLFWEPIIPWQPFSPKALQQARAEGKTVMVDFTADWCPNCKTNSRLAIEKEAVLKLVRVNGVAPLIADWTDKSPVIKKALNDLGYNSIPLLAIWPAQPAEKEVILLPDLISENQVLKALKEAGPSKPR